MGYPAPLGAQYCARLALASAAVSPAHLWRVRSPSLVRAAGGCASLVAGEPARCLALVPPRNRVWALAGGDGGGNASGPAGLVGAAGRASRIRTPARVDGCRKWASPGRFRGNRWPPG